MQVGSGLIVEALGGVLPPALVSAGALSLAWRPWRPPQSGPPPGRPAWGAAVGIGLGYAAGQAATHGWPAFPRFVGVKQGILYVAVLATLLGVAEALGAVSGRIRWPIRGLVAFAVPWALLGFVREHSWGTLEALLRIGGLALVLLVVWGGSEAVARRRPGPALPVAWIVLLALVGGALHLSGSTSLGQLAGTLAAPLGVVAVVSLRRPALALADGAGTPLALLLACLVLAGHYAGELPGEAALLLASAPLAPLLVLALPGRLGRGLPGGAAAVLAAALPAALAVWVARSAVAVGAAGGHGGY